MTAILARVRFWKSIADIPVNERQARVLTIMLDDFRGNLTIARWGRIASPPRPPCRTSANPLTAAYLSAFRSGLESQLPLVTNRPQRPLFGHVGWPSSMPPRPLSCHNSPFVPPVSVLCL